MTLKALVKPEGGKAVWGRSGAAMAAVLIAWREIEPDAPWWSSLILAVVVLVAAQVWKPSASLPRADEP